MYQKPTVTPLTTKHPITTSHALRPPSGKYSSSSTVGVVAAFTSASVSRFFWLGFRSTENIAKRGQREEVEDWCQRLGPEVGDETVIPRKEVMPCVYIPPVVVEDFSS